MSKMSHSHQPTMDEIDRKRAIEDGNEDLIPREPMTAIEIEMFQKWAASKPRFLVDLVHLGLVPKDLAAANIDLRQYMDERLLATIAKKTEPSAALNAAVSLAVLVDALENYGDEYRKGGGVVYREDGLMHCAICNSAWHREQPANYETHAKDCPLEMIKHLPPATPWPTWQSVGDLPVHATMHMIRRVGYGTWLVDVSNYNGRALPAVVWGHDKPELIMVVEPPSNDVIDAHRPKGT